MRNKLQYLIELRCAILLNKIFSQKRKNDDNSENLVTHQVEEEEEGEEELKLLRQFFVRQDKNVDELLSLSLSLSGFV